MKILIRTDSSALIGSGHMMRCLTLAEAFAARGCETHFISRDLPGNIIREVRSRGFRMINLPFDDYPGGKTPGQNEYPLWLGVDGETDARQTVDAALPQGIYDWLVVDHYAIEHQWEKAAAAVARHVLVIDDLANRAHECDLLIDYCPAPGKDESYLKLTPPRSDRLLGLAYLILRPEFAAARQKARIRDYVKRINVFMGGSDPDNLTLRVVAILKQCCPPGIEVDVIIGIGNRHHQEITRACTGFPNYRVHRRVENMAEMLLSADFAIGAGGVSAWERAYLGLPALIIVAADNQKPGSEAAASAGAAWTLGDHNKISDYEIMDKFLRIISRPFELREKSTAAINLFEEFKTPGVDAIFEKMKGLIHAVT